MATTHTNKDRPAPPLRIPPKALPRVAWQRLIREVRKRTAPRKPTVMKVGTSVEELAKQIRSRQSPRFFGLLSEHAAMIGQFFPEPMWATLDEADQICQHQFDILGSGKVDLGKEIDWHIDFKTGHRWPLEHHSRLTLTSPIGGFDVKVPWELSRFHHGVRLGQAYLYTLNEEYASELVTQIRHWIQSNPVEFGVNWAGPMDAAIRSVNLIWSVFSILESEAATDDFLATWLTSLQQHGDYLYSHLEDGWPRTNHLIANLTGLIYLGILFPEFKDAARWKEVGLKRLWEEIERQIYPDGVSYEASTSYHRLVTEMLLSVASLCLINEIPIPEVIVARLRSMLDAILYYTQPDGMAPQIGDADDGRLHILTYHDDPARVVNDHRHLLALGSLVLERELPEWAGYIDPTERGWAVGAGYEWQDAFWFFASDAAARYSDILFRTIELPVGVGPDDWVDVTPGIRVRASALTRHPLTVQDVASSREMEAAGLYVLRHDAYHMTIDAGDVGQNGAGGHAHNDVLSLTATAYGKPLLIDPGSYLYTSNPEMRNLFRSTSYHNTLQVGEAEINRFDGDLFRLTPDAQVTLHRWISDPAYDLFDASHNGYARLTPGLIHRRQVWFDKHLKLWLLHDQVSVIAPSEDGTPIPVVETELGLHFHFAPSTVQLDRQNNAILCEADADANLLLLPLGEFPLKARLDDGWFSPRYGVREPGPVAKFSGRVKLPCNLVLLIYPHQGHIPDVQTVRNVGRTALLNMRKTLSPHTRAASLNSR